MTFYLHEQDGTNPAFRQRAVAALPRGYSRRRAKIITHLKNFYPLRWKKTEHLTI